MKPNRVVVVAAAIVEMGAIACTGPPSERIPDRAALTLAKARFESLSSVATEIPEEMRAGYDVRRMSRAVASLVEAANEARADLASSGSRIVEFATLIQGDAEMVALGWREVAHRLETLEAHRGPMSAAERRDVPTSLLGTTYNLLRNLWFARAWVYRMACGQVPHETVDKPSDDPLCDFPRDMV